jgi:hypothetical protein
MTEEQDLLIRKIEQQLENLMPLDHDLSVQYEYDLYDEDGEPIVELFTEDLLEEILEHINSIETNQ